MGRLPVSKMGSDRGRITWLNEKILKHQEDQKVKNIANSKFKFFYKRPYEFLHTYEDIFSKEIYRFKASGERPVIIDCGANIGVSVLYFKSLYPDSTIIAFEPDANNFDLLKSNVLINGLQNVDLRKAAVWITEGEISFESSGSEASHISATAQPSAQAIPSVRLADILSGFQKIDFLKIDIEGAEWEVLNDAKAELGKVMHLFLEYHGKATETSKLIDLLQIVQNAGFAAYVQNAATGIKYPFLSTDKKFTVYDVQLNIFCFRPTRSITVSV